MAQFQSPETYVDGQQVTATRLNNQTNGAVALPGIITDQANITANTVASGDSVLLYDLSATALREANVSDVLGSNVDVTTSAVTGGANSDVVVTPNDGTIVTGQAYTSGDGLTVTVTSTAHGLVVGQVILVASAATGYNGTFRVATVATNSFTYVMTTAATPGSSTLSYTKKGSVRNAGNESIAGSLFVAGNAVISGTTGIVGATTISGALTSSGTANFTGAIQYDGTPVYSLSSVSEVTVPFNQADASTGALYASTCNQWRVITSLTSQTKTDKEIWVIEADFPLVYYTWAGGTKFSIHRLSTATNLSLEVRLLQNNATAYVTYSNEQVKMKCVIPAAVTFTAETLQLRFRYDAIYSGIAGSTANVGYGGSLTDPDITKTFRVTKYITA
jgi:hypothetical protein